MLTRSSSLLTEAIHSFADCANQVLLFIGMRQGARAADAKHPLGKGQAAFVAMQKRILEQALVIPFGSLTKVQGARANVVGYKPFRIPRFSNVSFQ